MKKFLFLASLFLIANANAGELTSYDAIKDSILKGNKVRFVMDFTKCDRQLKLDSINFVGAFTPNAIGMVGERITTSMKHLTLYNPHFPNQAVIEFVKYNLTSDDRLTLTASILSPTTYGKLSSDVNINCALGTAVKVFD